MKCKKVVKLQVGKDGIVSVETNSESQKKLEILRNGEVLKSYVIESDGDFSDEFRVNSNQFIIPKNDVSDLFAIDRFFKFRVVIGGQLVGFGSLQVFDNIPCCQEIAANVKNSDIVEISQSESMKPFALPDIDVKPLVEKTKQISDFFAALMAEDGYI